MYAKYVVQIKEVQKIWKWVQCNIRERTYDLESARLIQESVSSCDLTYSLIWGKLPNLSASCILKTYQRIATASLSWSFTVYQFSSVAQSCPTLCDPMNCSTPGLPAHHKLLELTQTHVHWVGDAIQPSHPLPSPSPPALNLSQNQGLFQWVSSSHQVAKVLEFQLQHQSFQRTLKTDLL